jgi:hypothetical protein
VHHLVPDRDQVTRDAGLLERGQHLAESGLVVGDRLLDDRRVRSGGTLHEHRPPAADPVKQPGREHLTALGTDLQQLVLDRGRAGVDHQDRAHRPPAPGSR